MAYKYTRVVHGLCRPAGWVGVGRDFAVFDGLGRIGLNMTKVLYF